MNPFTVGALVVVAMLFVVAANRQRQQNNPIVVGVQAAQPDVNLPPVTVKYIVPPGLVGKPGNQFVYQPVSTAPIALHMVYLQYPNGDEAMSGDVRITPTSQSQTFSWSKPNGTSGVVTILPYGQPVDSRMAQMRSGMATRPMWRRIVDIKK